MTSTPTPSPTFQVRPLDPTQLSRARETTVSGGAGTPDGLTSAGVILLAEGGEPLRCCLRDAVVGERCLLFNYQPPLPADSPYQERGAVFAHAEQSDCERLKSDGYPRAWRGRRQVLRAYDSRGFIHPASCVHDGDEPDAVVAGILKNPDVVEVHSRNVTYGCYMFALVRAT